MDEQTLARRRRERERNLEFCVCVFTQGGDVDRPCGAHQGWLEDETAALRRERDVLRQEWEGVRDMGVPWLTAPPGRLRQFAETVLAKADKAREEEE